MNRNVGIHIHQLLEGVGIAGVSGVALWAMSSDSNALQNADKTTWLYKNLGPQGMKTALLWAFGALLVYGIWRIVVGARRLFSE